MDSDDAGLPGLRISYRSVRGRIADFEGLSRHQSRRLGRRLFLDAIELRAPEVLDALAGDPFDRMADVYRLVGSHEAWHRHQREAGEARGNHVVVADLGDLFDWSSLGRARMDWKPELIAIREAIDTWARGFNLRDEWCRAIAFVTLRSWAESVELGEARRWLMYWPIKGLHEGPLTFPRRSEPATPPPESPPPYEPFRETAADARARYEEYVVAVQNWAESTGYGARTPRAPDAQHFAWLVEFQVGERSYGAIASTAETAISRQGVQSGVRRAAEFIGLTMRTRFTDLGDQPGNEP